MGAARTHAARQHAHRHQRRRRRIAQCQPVPYRAAGVSNPGAGGLAVPGLGASTRPGECPAARDGPDRRRRARRPVSRLRAGPAGAPGRLPDGPARGDQPGLQALRGQRRLPAARILGGALRPG
jgi:hypothetical protein